MWLHENDITTVIDLRDEREYKERPCRLEEEEGFVYLQMPVTGGGGVPESPDAVAASYLAMFDDQMDRIVDTIMNADSNVLYFCHAGKDRTGVVSAVILKRLGFDDRTIIDDYMETKDNLMDVLMKYAEDHSEVDINTIIPREENITTVLRKAKIMKLAYEMKYTHPTDEVTSVRMIPYSSTFQEAYREMYNECYHEMREALHIQPYDFIQDDSFFASGMGGVFLLVEDGDLIGSVTLKEDEIDDLIVKKDNQGQGYGRQILLWALNNIQTEQILLHVAGWNRKAINLYRKTGFEITNATAIGGNNMIREARKEDLSQLLELYLFLHEDRIPEQSKHLEETWKRIIEDPNHHLIVNEIDGKIISSCVCVIIPNLTRNVRPYAFVENVVTHADYRGKGYAGECLDYAREIAEQENCYKMMLLTGSKKPETLHFYEKAGYNSSDKTAFIQWLEMDK